MVGTIIKIDINSPHFLVNFSSSDKLYWFKKEQVIKIEGKLAKVLYV